MSLDLTVFKQKLKKHKGLHFDNQVVYRNVSAGFSKPAITHEIGKYVYEEGFDGIIYFSYPAWYLREKHPIHVVSAICIFMDKVDFCKPKNDSCTLQIYL